MYLTHTRTSRHPLSSQCRYQQNSWFAFMAALLLFSTQARAAEKTLWQIGKPDHASLEFNAKWDFAKGRDPQFIVGQSTPEKDWSNLHPGAEVTEQGRRVHTFTIVFNLPDAPRGVFYLTIDAMFRNPLVPEYFVAVNGKKGRFNFHPQLTYEIGDPDTAWDIIFSAQRLHVALPAAYFQRGENRILLSCGDDVSRIILPQGNTGKARPDLYYDALALSQDPEARFDDAKPELDAIPTIFYREQDDHKLREVVLLTATTGRRFERASASLSIGKGDYNCEVPTGYDFGQAECAVSVPEFAAATPAKLRVSLGKQSAVRELSLAPQKKWKLFLCPQMHLDMGYTDYRPISYEVHCRNIDQIIEKLESHPDYRFNPDGSFILKEYWRQRGPEWRARYLKLLREGRLTLPAQYFTINSGLASQEELFRQMYFSAGFSREQKIPLVYLNQTDVPAHSWALPSILQDAGVKYLAIASNPFRGAIILHGRVNEKSPFWWEGPDGAKVLTWFSRTYVQLEMIFSPEPNLPSGVNGVPVFLQAYNSPNYAPDAVMLYGTQSDNRPFAPEEVEFPDQWNKEFAYPKMITSTMPEFFDYMQAHYASSFATLKGDGGAWWEEMSAADASFGAMARKAKERVLVAEEAASLGAIVNRDFPIPLDEDRDIWENLLLYTEHTWGAAGTWTRPESEPARIMRRDKESFSERADLGSEHLLQRGLTQLADKIYTRGDTIIVFNSLSWGRGGLVEVELGRGEGLMDTATGKTVPLELIRRDPDESYDRVRFWVDFVPALGYHSYQVTPSSTATPGLYLPVSNVVENEFYRVTVDAARGGIASIFDKQLGQELVDTKSPYALDQYVYAGYGHEGSSLIEQRTRYNSTLLQYSVALPHPDLDVSAAGKGRVVSVRRMPWGTVLELHSSAVHTPSIKTEVRLFDREKRLELVNTIQKEAVKAPEGVYIAFPFAARQPVVRYEIQNAWVDPLRDQLPGANKEWFSGQHWVAVTSPDLSLGLGLKQAPLFTIGDIDRGLWPKTLELHNGTIFSYIMDNYDGDDERAYQEGTYHFTYTLSSASNFDPTALTRQGKETANPLEFVKVTDMDKFKAPAEPLDLPQGQFLDIDKNDVMLSVWKPAEDGNGHILRFYNTSDQPVTAQVSFPLLQFTSACSTNGLEVDGQPLAAQNGGFALSFPAHAILSVRVKGLKLK